MSLLGDFFGQTAQSAINAGLSGPMTQTGNYNDGALGGGWLGDVGEFLGNNWRPIAGIAGTAWGVGQMGRSQNNIVGELRRQAEEEFARRQALAGQQQAYNASASAAARAAAAQNEANRIAALRRQMQIEKRGFNKASHMYQPYADMAARLMPQMEQAYTGALNNAGLLAGYVFAPQAMAKLNATPSASQAFLPYKLPMEG